jgi:hypothetical protein
MENTIANIRILECVFFLIIMHVKYVSINGIPQAFLFFRFVDIIVITVHDRFWNFQTSDQDGCHSQT